MIWGAVAAAALTAYANYRSQQQAAAAQQAGYAQTDKQQRRQIAEQQRMYALSNEAEMERRAREAQINEQIQARYQALRGENIAALQPYQEAGQAATREQQALLGLSGQQAQQAAIQRFSSSPGQEFLRKQQERALLRSSAAIGGLGGGNVRTALQEQAFQRAQTDYDRQLQRLGALGGQGLSASQTQAGMQMAPGYYATGQDVGVVADPMAGAAAITAAPAAQRPGGYVVGRPSDPGRVGGGPDRDIDRGRGSSGGGRQSRPDTEYI